MRASFGAFALAFVLCASVGVADDGDAVPPAMVLVRPPRVVREPRLDDRVRALFGGVLCEGWSCATSGKVVSISPSADDCLLAVISAKDGEQKLTVVSTSTGRVLVSDYPKHGSIVSAAFAPPVYLVTLVSDCHSGFEPDVRVWDTRTGEMRVMFSFGSDEPDESDMPGAVQRASAPSALAVHPDGMWIAASFGSCVVEVPLPSPMDHAIGDSAYIGEFMLPTGAVTRFPDDHGCNLSERPAWEETFEENADVHFDCEDPEEWPVYVSAEWPPESWEIRCMEEPSGEVQALSYAAMGAPERERLLAVAGSDLVVYDVGDVESEGENSRALGGVVRGVTWLHDPSGIVNACGAGRSLAVATGEGCVHVWRITDENADALRCRIATYATEPGCPCRCGLSADGSRALSLTQHFVEVSDISDTEFMEPCDSCCLNSLSDVLDASFAPSMYFAVGRGGGARRQVLAGGRGGRGDGSRAAQGGRRAAAERRRGGEEGDGGVGLHAGGETGSDRDVERAMGGRGQGADGTVIARVQLVAGYNVQGQVFVWVVPPPPPPGLSLGERIQPVAEGHLPGGSLVRCVAWALKGTVVYSGGEDGTVTQWGFPAAVRHAYIGLA